MSRLLERLRQVRPSVERDPWRVDVSARSTEEPHRITYTVHEGVQWAFRLGPPDEDDDEAPAVT